MTTCLSHNFPPLYLKRNTTTRLLNLRTLLCMQLLIMKPCLSTLFDQYNGLWGVFTVKKHNFTQRFDLQDHARVQIFTYKDVSVCNVSCTVNHSGARPLPFPFPLSSGTGWGRGKGRVRVRLVFLVLEHEVFREARLRSRDKILCFDWSPPLLVEELACRHVGEDKLCFKNAALYVKSCLETFFSVKLTGH